MSRNARTGSLGGLTPQAAQIQEVIAMLGSMSEGQLQTVQQHMQDRFVTMQQRRGVPEEFGDGLFLGQRPLPFGGSHLRLPSGPAGIRTTTGSLSAMARPTPYQLSHRVASKCLVMVLVGQLIRRL